MSTPLHALTATEMVAAYRTRALSPVEVAQSVLAQVERWEPHLHALFLLRPERVLEQARASQARWQRGEPLGPPQVAAMACCMGALALTILKPKPASAG